MRLPDTKIVLGIMTDEGAMYELLSKFLSKEGYDSRRVSSDASDADNLSLVILAPTRDLHRSRSWFDNLKKSKPTVLVVQCCDDDFAEIDESVVVLKERPLNLRQLSETIKATLEKSGKSFSQAT
jgi:DNA-binding response OmpR family regulator